METAQRSLDSLLRCPRCPQLDSSIRRRLGRPENRLPPLNKSDMMDAPVVHESPVLISPLFDIEEAPSISLDIRARMVAMRSAESIDDP